MEKIIRERVKQREKAIEMAREFVLCASYHLDVRMAYVVGSYCRGDFNEWSDIDVLIVVGGDFGSPFEKLERIKECLRKYPKVEPIILTLREFDVKKRKNNPMVVEALRRGIKII